MSVVLDLEPSVVAALESKASAKGLAFDDYVEELLRKEIALDELLAPVRKQFADSNMSEEELDEFFEGVRQKAFEERFPNGRP